MHLLAPTPTPTPTHSLCCIDGEIFCSHLTLLVRQATLSIFGPEKKHMDPRTLTLSCGRPCFGSSCTSSSRHYTLCPTPASKTCNNVHDKKKAFTRILKSTLKHEILVFRNSLYSYGFERFKPASTNVYITVKIAHVVTININIKINPEKFILNCSI